MLAAFGRSEFELLPATQSVAKLLEQKHIPYSIDGLSAGSDIQVLEQRLFPNGDEDFIVQIVLHKNNNIVQIGTNALCSYEDEATALSICEQINRECLPIMCILHEETRTLRLYGEFTFVRPEDAGEIARIICIEYFFPRALFTAIDLANSNLNAQIDLNI